MLREFNRDKFKCWKMDSAAEWAEYWIEYKDHFSIKQF